LAGAGAAEAAVVLAGSAYGDDASLLLDAAVGILGTEAVVGATAHGVLAAGQEFEDPNCVAILAWSGVETMPFLLADPKGEELAACQEIAERLGGAREEDLVVLFPDPRNFRAAEFLAASRETLAPARLVGAGAGSALDGELLQWCGRVVSSGGISGLVLRGASRPRIGVTQACRPATELLTVTRSRGHWILELDGRPALDLFKQVARGPLAADLRRASASVLAGLPVDPEATELEPGAYLVRQMIGFEPDANAFAIPEMLKPGDRLALVTREPESARDDLKAMLARLGEPPSAFGLYFDCCARGSSFFGVSGLEAGYIESAFGAAPLAGMFGSCEIGPLGSRTELLTYTGVLALIDA
jgi:small ligand-binding sensory domain FIST